MQERVKNHKSINNQMSYVGLTKHNIGRSVSYSFCCTWINLALTILISCKISFHSWLWIIRQYIHIYVCRRSKVAREPNLPSAYVTSVYFESSASLFPSHPQINTGAAHRTLVLAKARDKNIFDWSKIVKTLLNLKL